MSGSELAIVQSVSSAVNALANTAGAVIASVQANHFVHQEDLARIKREIKAVRFEENSRLVARLARINMNEVLELYSLAEAHASSPEQYMAAMRVATQATRLLQDNLDNFARELRR